MARYLIIDGRNLLWRATSTMMELRTHQTPTGGMFGFMTMLLRIHEEHGGKTVVAWEGSNNFRRSLFPEYKQKEPGYDQDPVVVMVRDQEKKLRKFLRTAGVPQYVGVECEADDVIGTLAKRKFAKAERVVIYSMDSDLRQLVGGNVVLVSATWDKGDKLYDADAVRARYDGLLPLQVADLKALMGDTSDGIPGLRGVGIKTASKLVSQYGSLEGIIKASEAANEDWPVAPRFASLIKSEQEAARLYLKLTTIKCDAKLKVIKPAPDVSDLELLMHRYRFRTLIRKRGDIMALAG